MVEFARQRDLLRMIAFVAVDDAIVNRLGCRNEQFIELSIIEVESLVNFLEEPFYFPYLFGIAIQDENEFCRGRGRHSVLFT